MSVEEERECVVRARASERASERARDGGMEEGNTKVEVGEGAAVKSEHALAQTRRCCSFWVDAVVTKWSEIVSRSAGFCVRSSTG